MRHRPLWIILLLLTLLLTACPVNDQQASPDYSLTLGSSSVTLAPGGSASIPVTLSRTGGFSSDVTLHLTGLPDGLSAGTSILTGGTTAASLTVTASFSMSQGNYPVTVTGTSGSSMRTVTLTITVSGPGGGGGTISGTVSIAPGATTTAVTTNSAAAAVPKDNDPHQSRMLPYAPRQALPQDIHDLPDFVPGEIIVRFKPGISTQSFSTLSVGNSRLELIRVVPDASLRLYRTEAGTDATLALIEALKRRDDVLYAQPNYLYYPLRTPSDVFYPYQWHYPAINLPQAWDIATGSSDVVVAVLDSGILFDANNVTLSHPDFEPVRMLPGYDFVSNLQNAADGDGRDPNPYDAGDDTTTFYHGTHVAGTVGAWTDNTNVDGVAGVDWHTKLLNVRVIGLMGAELIDILEAAWWSAGGTVTGLPVNLHPAHILNMSLGGAQPCTPAEADFYTTLMNAGVIVVVAAGNSNIDANGFAPASCPGVITVGATNMLGERAYYSNYGSRIDLMAPGGDERIDLDGNGVVDGVVSPIRDDVSGAWVYGAYQGTSMAAPHVAGVLALMKSIRLDLTMPEALTILQQTARPLMASACHAEGPTEAERILTMNDCGAGLIDAYAALQFLTSGTGNSGDLSGTEIVACYPLNETACEAERTRFIVLEKAGNSSSYTLGDLASGTYEVFAWKDSDGNGTIDAGDLYGYYTTDGQTYAPVAPSATGIDFQLSPIVSSTMLENLMQDTRFQAALEMVMRNAPNPH